MSALIPYSETDEFLDDSYDSLVDTEDAEESAARQITDQIKTAVEGAWNLIREAYTSRAWAALGYDSWDGYCSAEFGTSRLRLPREERQEIVGSLRDAGLSVRAIAAATGLGVGTVHAASAGVQNRTPAPVTGIDGKSYAPTQPPRSEPAPVPEPVASSDADLLSGRDWAPAVARQGPVARPESSPVPSDDSLLAAIERDKPGATAEVNRARTRARWSRAMAGLSDIPLQDPDAVGAALSDTELSLATGVIEDAQRWLAKVRAARQGLRLVEGGTR